MRAILLPVLNISGAKNKNFKVKRTKYPEMLGKYKINYA